jgi:hypothetical protein
VGFEGVTAFVFVCYAVPGIYHARLLLDFHQKATLSESFSPISKHHRQNDRGLKLI